MAGIDTSLLNGTSLNSMVLMIHGFSINKVVVVEGVAMLLCPSIVGENGIKIKGLKKDKTVVVV